MIILGKLIGRAVFALAVLILTGFVLSGSSFAHSDDEDKLGEKVAKEVEQRWEVVTDPYKVALAEMVLDKCAPFAERKLNYRIKVIEEKSPNAFAIPGGRIYITTGMLDFARSDDELAAVIAHEIVHSDKNHILRQASRNQKLTIGALLVAVASKGQGAVMLLANLAQVAIMNAYSRDFEREADLGALHILQEAGYEPSAAVTVLERLKMEQLKRPYVDPGIFMDHPKTEERIDYILKAMEKEGLQVNRKIPLGLLRTKVVEAAERYNLLVDDLVVCWGPKVPEVFEILERLAHVIDENLKLETAPYDIAIMETKEGKALRIGRAIALYNKDMREGMPSLEEIRKRLVLALENAKKQHPAANYFR